MLHLNHRMQQRPRMPNMVSSKEHTEQMNLWREGATAVAIAVPSLDFLGWNGEHYVVVRGQSSIPLSNSDKVLERVMLKELPLRRRLDCGKGVDLGSEEAWWMERKDVPIDYELPSSEATN
jgi:hypothetical protein